MHVGSTYVDSSNQDQMEQTHQVQARQIARDVMVRLAEDDRLCQSIERAKEQSLGRLQWLPMSVGYGDAGLVIAYSVLSRQEPNAGWEHVAHRYLERAIRSYEVMGSRLGSGLFSGLSGLLFATHYASHSRRRYGSTLNVLEDHIIARIKQWPYSMEQTEVPVEAYDLVSGATGIAACLLSVYEEGGHVHDTLMDVLDWIIGRALKGPIGFCVSPEDAHIYMPYAKTAVVNFGMAHGIPGIIAVLALAKIGGIQRSGLDDTIKRLSNWVASLIDSNTKTGWMVPYSARVEEDGVISDPKIARVAWCYGLPGIARALWLAGEALGDRNAQRFSEDALCAAVEQMTVDISSYSPTFCHGLAGVLRIVQVFAKNTGDKRFDRLSATLTDAVISAYTPETLLGFRAREDDNTIVDNSGLLNGSIGTALVLLSGNEPNRALGWDRVFLLN